MNALLSVENLKITLCGAAEPIVRGSSFSIDRGKSLVLLGQSGCGKTMTCRAIMGLLEKKRFVVEGSVKMNGRELLSLSEKERCGLYGDKIVLIPQNPMTAFDPSMRLGKQMDETLRLHSTLRKPERQAKILFALERSGLKEAERVYKSFPFELSGGMLQRVLIAMCLMVKAQLIVADEPTTALDVVHRNEIVDSFAALRESGCAVLMVTHDFAAAKRLGGRLMIMNAGEVIESGTAESVLGSPQHAYTKELISASSLSAIRYKGERLVC